MEQCALIFEHQFLLTDIIVAKAFSLIGNASPPTVLIHKTNLLYPSIGDGLHLKHFFVVNPIVTQQWECCSEIF